MGKVISLFGNKNSITKITTNNKKSELIEAGKKIFEAARPEWAVAVIIATLQENIIDPSENKPIRRVILAWSSRTRNSFSEMKKAAAKFEDTKCLTEGENLAQYEHRKNNINKYDYYLAKYMYSGWQIRKETLGYNLDKLYEAVTHPENFLVNK